MGLVVEFLGHFRARVSCMHAGFLVVHACSGTPGTGNARDRYQGAAYPSNSGEECYSANERNALRGHLR